MASQNAITNTANNAVDTNVNAGSAATVSNDVVDLMKYKAAKYHYKIQGVLNERYIAQGIPVPKGYEQYLEPFE